MRSSEISNLNFLVEKEKLALAEVLHKIEVPFKVRQVILFGSKARGDFESESDIDLLVLTELEDRPENRHYLSDMLFDVNPYYEPPISVTYFNKDDWDSGKVLPTFKSNILKDGVQVVF
ncbi:nucleotidyltransferase domain-containing protein [Paenibacillus sp. P96]|uniref:Nucleotidyltransferase domain-containing protein n=1 Tax=Paenibacillus zeirhizosphaerae TaxID=2987519 RepID=A0ABT9FSJ5_9BACL|nr:nucleotidyltransferase domain-containing protein [Paenibacillus sp. P96]MDP4097452.1 nucleotidyltransferase domain-containing protein [Paenibacillus sp. P96]